MKIKSHIEELKKLLLELVDIRNEVPFNTSRIESHHLVNIEKFDNFAICLRREIISMEYDYRSCEKDKEEIKESILTSFDKIAIICSLHETYLNECNRQDNQDLSYSRIMDLQKKVIEL